MIPKDTEGGITSIIDPHTLARLHTITNPQNFIKHKELVSLLQEHPMFVPRASISYPLFNGTLYFVKIIFNTPKGSFSISDANMQTALDYTNKAVIPISRYVSQYGKNRILVSQNIIPFPVDLPSNTFSDSQLQDWINSIVDKYNLGSDACIIVLNGPLVWNTLHSNDFAVGYHDYTGTNPYCYCSVGTLDWTIKDTVDQYAAVLSHEIAEMTADPLANYENPEICDPCSNNCQNQFFDFFDANNYFVGGRSSAYMVPKSFEYAYFINSIIQPKYYDPRTDCKIDGVDGQTACVYAPPTTGKVMIADFSSGKVPAEIKYWENWGDNPLLNGWIDSDDIHLVGDFMGLGHKQVLFVNTKNEN